MTQTVLTFGDSNTYGTTPTKIWGQGRRFDAKTRWTGVMMAELGPAWTLVEEGLPGRTATALPDPLMGPQVNGQIGLQIALHSHAPIDVLTLMLGTNDCKTGFGLTADAITGHLAALLAMALHPDMQAHHDGFQVLVIAPPVIREDGIYGTTLMDAREKSRMLPACYARLAAHNGVAFLDASALIETCAEDGLHFDAAAHQVLGRAVAKKIASLSD